MRDLLNNIAPELALFPQLTTATVTAARTDRQGYDSVSHLALVGTGGIAFSATNRIDVVLLHGNASDGSDLTPVTDPNQVILRDGLILNTSTGVFKAITSNASDERKAYRIGYVGPNRFSTVRAVFVGTHATGTIVSSVAIKGHPIVAPA